VAARGSLSSSEALQGSGVFQRVSKDSTSLPRVEEQLNARVTLLQYVRF